MTNIEKFLSKKFDVIIVHVTDTYFVEETNVNGKVDIPGFGRIRSFLDSIQNNSDVVKQIPVIVLHGGDFLFPSLMSNYFNGKQIVDVLNQCGLDYCTIGNHDFDGGIKILKKRVLEAHFEVLSANFYNQQDKKYSFKIHPYKIWSNPNNKDNFQIAIIGIAGKSTIQKAKQNGFYISSTKSSLKKILVELRQKHPTITHLIILSHMNNTEDLEIKQWLEHNWNDYIFVLGGHDHNRTLRYDKLNPRSILLKGQSNGRTIQIIGIRHKENNTQASRTIHNLLNNVYVMDSNELSSFTPNIKIQNTVKKWEQRLEKETNELKSDITIKQFKKNIILDATELELRKGSTNFGNFVVDCVLKYTDSDIVLINSGHFRGDRKIGNILKLSDLKRIFVLSTKNRIIKTKMTSIECKEFLRYAYSEEGRGKILQVSKNTVKLLNDVNKDEFSVTMLYDMINEDDDGFVNVLANIRNITPRSLRKHLRKDILCDCELIDMILNSSSDVQYDPSIRLSVKKFSKMKL